VEAVILAGGLGTRLYPLTYATPKCLIPLLDRPFVSYQLRMLADAGVEHVVVSVGQDYAAIEEYVRAKWAGSLDVTFSPEDAPLGTGGAFALAAEKLRRPDEPFLALNGDVLTDLNPAVLAKAHRGVATLTTFEVPDASRYGLILTKPTGEIDAFIEKPAQAPPKSLINAGVYVLTRDALAGVAVGAPSSIEHDIFPRLIAEGKTLTAYEHKGFWNDVGTLATFIRASFEVIYRWFLGDVRLFGGERGDFDFFKDLIYIHRGAIIKGPTSLEHRVIVMNEAEVNPATTLNNAVVMPGAVVHAGASLKSVIVGPGAEIAEGSTEENVCIALEGRAQITG
jgi:NDP-sugar pyrophosphorylase family protein